MAKKNKEERPEDRDSLGRFAIANKLSEVWTEEKAIEFIQKVYDNVMNDGNCRSLAKACALAGGYETLIYYLQDKFNLKDSEFEPIKACKEMIKFRLMEQGLDGDVNAPMAIFILKANHGMTDKPIEEPIKLDTNTEIIIRKANNE